MVRMERGVQRRQHQVAGLGGGQGERDGLEVAQLADGDDVRVLAQGAAQGAGEGAGVRPHLALVDHALLRGVEVLDRVLDGDDVVVPVLVDDVEQGGEGRGLAAAGRAGQQHHALVVVGEPGERGRQPQVAQGGRPGGDHPEDGVDPPLLPVGVAAEAPLALQGAGEVDLPALAQEGALLGGEDLLDQPPGGPRRHRAAVEVGIRPSMRILTAPPCGGRCLRAEAQGMLEQAVERPRGLQIEGGPGGSRGRDRNRGRHGRRGQRRRGGHVEAGHRLHRQGWHRLGVEDRRPDSCGRCGRRRRRGGLLLGDVVALHRHDLGDLLRLQVALVDQDLAQPELAPPQSLELGGLEELLAGDELVVQGDPPEQEVVRCWNHWRQGSGGGVRRQRPGRAERLTRDIRDSRDSSDESRRSRLHSTSRWRPWCPCVPVFLSFPEPPASRWSRIRGGGIKISQASGARAPWRETTMVDQAGSRGVIEPGGRAAGWGLVTALALLAVALLLAVFQSDPPAPKPESAPPAEFSGGRAQAVLRELLGDGAAHPVGSPAAAQVRGRILARLRGLGLAPEVQEAVACAGSRCARVRNVLARLPGREPGKSVLLLAHYDSVPAGAGASDDLSGVAAILEVAGASSRPARRCATACCCCFDEGEEAGLLGARAFAAHSPAMAEVGAVVNLEARGTAGPSLMFETSGPNAWMVSRFAARVPRPFTSSLFATVYQYMPNDTDLTVFKARGIPGLNFAFIDNPTLYHTALDDFADASAASLQHHGDNALAAVRGLSEADLASPPRGRAVWFDLFHAAVVHWPAGLSPLLGLLALALTLGAAFLARRRGLAVGAPSSSASAPLWRRCSGSCCWLSSSACWSPAVSRGRGRPGRRRRWRPSG